MRGGGKEKKRREGGEERRNSCLAIPSSVLLSFSLALSRDRVRYGTVWSFRVLYRIDGRLNEV